jgi:phospholipid transport system substrate-binding protein
MAQAFLRRSFFQSCLALAALLIGGPAFAGAATDAVKAKQVELFKLLEKDDADSKKKVSAIFDEWLDYGTLAEASLGDEWAKLKDDQKKEFTGLLKQLVNRAVEKNLKKVLSFKIEYAGEETKGKNTLVRMRAKHKTDPRAEVVMIDFLVADKGKGKFQVIDIIPEEVSLVETNRTNFVKIIREKGYPALVEKMKEKIAKGE